MTRVFKDVMRQDLVPAPLPPPAEPGSQPPHPAVCDACSVFCVSRERHVLGTRDSAFCSPVGPGPSRVCSPTAAGSALGGSWRGPAALPQLGPAVTQTFQASGKPQPRLQLCPPWAQPPLSQVHAVPVRAMAWDQGDAGNHSSGATWGRGRRLPWSPVGTDGAHDSSCEGTSDLHARGFLTRQRAAALRAASASIFTLCLSRGRSPTGNSGMRGRPRHHPAEPGRGVEGPGRAFCSRAVLVGVRVRSSVGASRP